MNQIVPYIKETNTVRMWGGLTWINDGKTQIIDEAIENVEMNLWSSGWADGIEMYDMGYKLINTIDSYNYMVPNGGMGRGAYGDLLNINSVFNNFEANLVATRSSGWKYIPSGDDQALGAVFAIWSDNIDKHASGLDESDYFYRFFDALPVYAEKTWAATGKEKGTIDNLTTIASNVGIGPRTNPYFQLESKTDELATYTFGDLSDTSGNNRDILENKAKLDEDALVLDQKKSYVETPITKVGKGNELSFDITMNKVGKPGQVIFESDAAYGTQDIRIMESGKLGFTRELYDYEFDYTLPVGKNVNIRIVSKQQKTELHVNGKFIGNAVGKYFHNDILKKENLTNASFNIPIQRIGSKTNAVQATIDNVKVSKTHSVDTYNKSAWAGQTNTETIYNDVEGRLSYAFDNNASSIWHSNWKGATDKLTGNNTFYAEIDMNETYTINSFSFTPRTDTNSGLVTKADLFVKASNDEEWIQVAEDALFAADRSQKTFYFDEQDVRYIKFVAKSSNDGWVAVSEFDVASIPKSQMNVYVDYTGEGTVDGTGQYDAGTEVTLTATPAKGYVFIGWIDFSDTVISTDSTLTFTVNANTNLEARFTREAYVVDIDGTEYLVPVGEGLDLPRPQKPGYEFDGYYEGDTKVDVAKPFENDVNLSTKFVPYSVEIKIEDTSHGSVEVTRNEDGSVTINALPSNGYVFKSWSISERTRDEATVVTDNPYTFIPTMHTIVNVTFEKDETESTDVQKTALKLFIDMMDENVTLGYVDELIGPAKTEVLEALAEAKTIYEKVDATEEEVNASVIRLSEAFTYLSLVKGDLTLLQQLYDTCNALDLDKYHNGATKELFIEALEYAYGILTLEGGALQPEIDEALENLNTTYAGLVSKPDKSLLAYLINVANSKSSMHERYTETSYAALVEALSKSQVVYDNPEATKAEVEKQVSDLSMAISSLRLKVDRSYLEEKVKAIKSISYDMYTEASVTKLMEAIEKVEAFLITPEGDAQQEANMMLELSKILDEAVYGLEKKANGDASHTKPNHPDYVISNPSVDTKDGSSTKPSKNVNSGDETQSGTLGLICISSLLGVMILLFKKKKERI
ncbi:hypothetical protein A4S06_10345 [Erysipelotrichaceae bacterium MTC7]|nr:hypothetical protein A4S06_10345 [Erysipelotrichaceae bacterium MTC7]